MSQKILLVEDDAGLAKLVKDFLQTEGYDVTVCAHGLKAKKELQEQQFDLILCDVMLPGASGFELITQIRTSFNGPILFMTAQTQLSSQLKGLQLGAQDYMLKPVDPRLLLAKVKVFLPAVVPEIQKSQVLQQFNLRLDRMNKTATLENQLLLLTTAELNLLEALLDHFGSVVSREWLFREQLFRDYDGIDRTMDGRASRLRKKLQQIDPHWTIQHTWRLGYSLIYQNSAGNPA
jgi:DNA-binding response OmpR family regulator